MYGPLPRRDRCFRPLTKWWSTVDGADARINASEANGHGERGPLAAQPCELTRLKWAAVVRWSAAKHPRWANRRVQGGEDQPRESTRLGQAAIVRGSEHRLRGPSSSPSCLYVQFVSVHANRFHHMKTLWSFAPSLKIIVHADIFASSFYVHAD